jgi:hypothetical protein
VAKVSGLPGFMNTLPKWIVPLASNKGFTQSLSPIDTPPATIHERAYKMLHTIWLHKQSTKNILALSALNHRV